MNRRDFLAASPLAAAAPLSLIGDRDPDGAAAGEYYELRRYHMLYGPKQKALHDFLAEAAIPAWNRLGIGPVGAFNVVFGTSSPTLYVLLPHPDLASVATLRRRLAEDAAYRSAGAAFLDAPLADPAFVRIESSLMSAFSGLPKLEVPPEAAGNQPRIFELRRYESHGDPAGVRKIEMFNEGREIEIFRKTGLRPVFFGEALVGQHLPNLTYMLSFPDMATRDRAWDTFRQDPEWKTLSADPYYSGTVSTISDVILRPTPYSQI